MRETLGAFLFARGKKAYLVAERGPVDRGKRQERGSRESTARGGGKLAVQEKRDVVIVSPLTKRGLQRQRDQTSRK